MAQIGSFFSRLFSSGGTRGLSGDGDLVFAADAEQAYFNAGFCRHQTREDLVEDPGFLWIPSAAGGRRSGLKGHILSRRGTGITHYTDVVIVLSQVDWERISQNESWKESTSSLLNRRFAQLCAEHDIHRLFPQRPLQFRFIGDGTSQMDGEVLGLREGEFATGLLANSYTGPTKNSRAIIAIHLNIPGIWDDYFEVGRLYSDQALFTLGSHWLDNFSHVAFPRPALYRLQHQPDSGFIHVIDPDVQDLYEIVAHEQESGPSILTIQDINGRALVHMVLELIETAAVDPGQETSLHQRQILASEAPPTDTLIEEDDEDDVPTQVTKNLGAPAVPVTIPSSGFTAHDDIPSERSVIPTGVTERILSLQECGALLQKVHFNNFMLGYDIYIGANGQVGTDIANPAVIIQVRTDMVRLVAQQPGVYLDGRLAAPNNPFPLNQDTRISIGAQVLQYIDLRQYEISGWPYVAEIRREGGRVHMVFGDRYQLGRARTCRVKLPDKPHTHNIIWRPEVADGVTIRARSGEIPKSRFYTDSIMVGTVHAELDLTKAPMLQSQARHCYSYVRRDDAVLVLSPTTKKGTRNIDLLPGDEVLVGNCVFSVGYPPLKPVVEEAAPLTAADLAAAMDDSPEREVVESSVTVDEEPVPSGRGSVPLNPESLPHAEAIHSTVVVDASLDTSESGLEPTEELSSDDLRSKIPARISPLNPPTLSDIQVPLQLRRPDSQPPKSDPEPAVSPAPSQETLVQESPEPPPLVQESSQPPVTPPAEVPVASAPSPVVEDVEDSGDVVVVDEQLWQLELGRPASLTQTGWMVSGKVTVGNHSNATIIIPENRSSPGQSFLAREYYKLSVRGQRTRITLCNTEESRLLESERPVEQSISDKVTMQVIRRDEDGEPDFAVNLRLVPGSLPDPRARLLTIDQSDSMVRAMFTLGLPLRTPRQIALGSVSMTLEFQGDSLQITDFIETYRKADGGYLPFFVSHNDGAFMTAPEDGSPIQLNAGDRLMIGSAIYVFSS